MPAMPRPSKALKILKKIIKNNPEELNAPDQKQEMAKAENPYMREMRMTIKR